MEKTTNRLTPWIPVGKVHIGKVLWNNININKEIHKNKKINRNKENIFMFLFIQWLPEGAGRILFITTVLKIGVKLIGFRLE